MKNITAKNILNHELIGLNTEIIHDSNPNNILLKGKIVNESLKTVTIQTDKGKKTIIKKEAVFQINFPNGKLRVLGSTLLLRPEDRAKRRIRKSW